MPTPAPPRKVAVPPEPEERTPSTDLSPAKPGYGPRAVPPRDQALAKTDKPLSDGQVLDAAAVANEGEVKVAELALGKANSPEVKQFANVMKESHGKALRRIKTLGTKGKIARAESDLSAYLQSDTEATLNALRDKEGKEFDRAYMEAQVKAHQDILTAIDNRLSPNAMHREVKSMVNDLRGTIVDHLDRAERVQKRMDTKATSSSGGEPKGRVVPGKAPSEVKARTHEPKPVEKR
ncbi:MAG TPA: DUF4142 domain-containing protein [Labilithrix sp.]|nr:DUF4142 domain-containing protein [Labilithrix sp.]